MKPIALIIFGTFLLTSCASSQKPASSTAANSTPATPLIDASQQDGLSYKAAVFVPEKSESTGPHWEYEWIKAHYSNYKVKLQALTFQGKRPYDIITIQLADGTTKDIYFDIANYYGKF